jgi:hypothetical protein
VANAVNSDRFLSDGTDPLPPAGDRVLRNGRQLAWQAARFDHHVIDFGAFLGRGVHWSACLAYAVAYVHSETEQASLILRIGWDDYARIELNGTALFQSEQSPWTGPDAVGISDVSLRKGQNVLVFKIANWIGPWLGAVRFTTADGQPVQGVQVTLEPKERGPE